MGDHDERDFDIARHNDPTHKPLAPWNEWDDYDLPPVDRRAALVTRAEGEIGLSITTLGHQHGLTYAELIAPQRHFRHQTFHAKCEVDRGESGDS